jgi:hypothetical protein
MNLEVARALSYFVVIVTSDDVKKPAESRALLMLGFEFFNTLGMVFKNVTHPLDIRLKSNDGRHG